MAVNIKQLTEKPQPAAEDSVPIWDETAPAQSRTKRTTIGAINNHTHAYEPEGSIAAHEAAADPHPGYTTEAEQTAAIEYHEARSGAHMATNITNVPANGLKSDDVQGAINELASKASGGGQKLIVASSGGDFTSVKEAVEYVNGRAGADGQYVIELAPETFTEDPFTISEPVIIVGANLGNNRAAVSTIAWNATAMTAAVNHAYLYIDAPTRINGVRVNGKHPPSADDDYSIIRTTSDLSMVFCNVNHFNIGPPSTGFIESAIESFGTGQPVVALSNCFINAQGQNQTTYLFRARANSVNSRFHIYDCDIGDYFNTMLDRVISAESTEPMSGGGRYPHRFINVRWPVSDRETYGAMRDVFAHCEADNYVEIVGQVIRHWEVQSGAGGFRIADEATATTPGIVYKQGNVWTVGSSGCDFTDIKTALAHADAEIANGLEGTTGIVQLTAERFDVAVGDLPIVIPNNVTLRGSGSGSFGDGFNGTLLTVDLSGYTGGAAFELGNAAEGYVGIENLNIKLETLTAPLPAQLVNAIYAPANTDVFALIKDIKIFSLINQPSPHLYYPIMTDTDLTVTNVNLDGQVDTLVYQELTANETGKIDANNVHGTLTILGSTVYRFYSNGSSDSGDISTLVNVSSAATITYNLYGSQLTHISNSPALTSETSESQRALLVFDDLATATKAGTVTLTQAKGVNTWTVGAVGCDFTDPKTAIEAVTPIALPPGEVHTIEVYPGKYETSEVHTNGAIHLKGMINGAVPSSTGSRVVEWEIDAGGAALAIWAYGSEFFGVENMDIVINTNSGPMTPSNYDNAVGLTLQTPVASLKNVHVRHGNTFTGTADLDYFAIGANSGGVLVENVTVAFDGSTGGKNIIAFGTINPTGSAQRIRGRSLTGISNHAGHSGETILFHSQASSSGSNYWLCSSGLNGAFKFDRDAVNIGRGQSMNFYNCQLDASTFNGPSIYYDDLATATKAGTVTLDQIQAMIDASLP